MTNDKSLLRDVLRKNKNSIIFLFLISVGIFIRFINFTKVPSGFNQDEAFAAYEAFSLMNYGVDSFGYHNPVYFISWGSGMNVLASYLAIPFFRIFGCSEFTFRLPQLVLSIISLAVFYLILKELFSSRTALVGLFLLVISPWHIMVARWGLESNLAPHFLLYGFYFFIKGIKSNNRFWLLSALMYGASLYSYAIMWAVVPLTLVFYIVYIIVSNKKISLKYAFLSAGVLFLLALPLMLFVLVNKDIIPEIKTSFISVPRIPFLRDGEFSLKNMLSADTYKSLFSVAVLHTDGLIWNSTDYGLFYVWSIPFQFVGLIRLVISAYKKLKSKIFSYEVFILLSILAGVIVSLMISDINVNKANSIHYFNLMLITAGVDALFSVRIKWVRLAKIIVVGAYAVSFIMFSSYYLREYGNIVFGSGISEAVEYTKQQGYETVYVYSYAIPYPHILFADKTPREVYEKAERIQDKVHLDVTAFSNYVFVTNVPMLGINDAFIIDAGNIFVFDTDFYNIEVFDHYAVVTR